MSTRSIYVIEFLLCVKVPYLGRKLVGNLVPKKSPDILHDRFNSRTATGHVKMIHGN